MQTLDSHTVTTRTPTTTPDAIATPGAISAPATSIPTRPVDATPLAPPDVGAVVPGPADWLGQRSPTVERYEERARRAESSPYPTLLKVGRVVVWITWAVIAFNAVVLTMAFLFHLGGADPQASFASWIYRSADHSMAPFRGIFPTRTLSGRSVFDISLLFSAGVYIVGALVLDGVHRWLGARVAEQRHQISTARATADAAALQFEQQQQYRRPSQG